MIRALPVLLELGLLIFALIDAIQTPTDEVRNLPKLGWIVLIVVLPLVGSIAWLVAGRPQRAASGPRTAGFPEYERDRWAPRRPGGRPAPRGPDDDPDFLSQVGDQERLRSWEQSLRRREEELRRREGGDS